MQYPNNTEVVGQIQLIMYIICHCNILHTLMNFITPRVKISCLQPLKMWILKRILKNNLLPKYENCKAQLTYFTYLELICALK